MSNPPALSEQVDKKPFSKVPAEMCANNVIAYKNDNDTNSR